jgi:hypothetical protein
MLSLIPLPPVLTRSVSDGPSSSHGCPSTTVRPDTNGWVPPGTCGYISRPYYPSIVAALIFSAVAATILVRYALMIIGVNFRHRRRLSEGSISLWRDNLLLPWVGALISTCLLAAYILRAFGTRYQQVPQFVASSDTFVLVCPICQSSVSTPFAYLDSFCHLCAYQPAYLSGYLGADYPPRIQ